MEYILKRSKRKTLAVEVDSAANVIVRGPRWVTKGEIERFVLSHQEWIEKQILKAREELKRRETLGKFTEEDLKTIRKEAKSILPPRVEELATLMGIEYKAISLRKQKTRWGSCSSKGNISLNCLLAITPKEIQDYVIIHELAHIRQMNHSKAFWDLVEKYDPNYKEHRKWLRVKGSDLIAMI